MLEECGFRLGRDWKMVPVNIGAGDQFQPELLAIGPDNKIQALVDPSGPDGKPISLFESGAILLYPESKIGKVLPKSDRLKFEVLQWLMFQMESIGPMLVQTHHFRKYFPEKIDYAINRYTHETKRLHAVMNKQLATYKFIDGDQSTIANISTHPWLRSWEDQSIGRDNYPHLRAWFDRISARRAVQRGVKVLAELSNLFQGAKEHEILFDKTQFQKRRNCGSNQASSQIQRA